MRGARRDRRLPGSVGSDDEPPPRHSDLLELGGVLDVGAPPDALAGRAAFLVDAERALGLGALALGNIARVANADGRDERAAVHALDDPLDVREQIVR